MKRAAPSAHTVATMANDLADAIRDARVARNLSQVELARRVGVHSTYLSRLEGATWERGGPWPSDGVLRALARVLDLSSSTLIELRASAQRIAEGNGRTVRLRSANRKASYAVSVGDQRVQSAARRHGRTHPVGWNDQGDRRSARHPGFFQPTAMMPTMSTRSPIGWRRTLAASCGERVRPPTTSCASSALAPNG